MSYRSIIGHREQIEAFQRAFARRRIAHAYLLSGLSGIGKRRFAHEVAKMLNCVAGGVDPCDACLSCRKIEHGNHPDVLHVEPEGKFIKIAQIRALQHELSYKPYEGSHRVVIVESAESFHTAAANAILKTLEEPPVSTIFLLLTASPHLLLPTIRSRCQLIRFSPLPAPLIEAELRKRGVPEERSAAIAAIAQGSLGRALDLLENEERLDLRRERIERLLSLSPNRGDEILAFAEVLSKGDDLEDTLTFFETWFRDLLVVRWGGGRPFNLDLEEELLRRAPTCEPSQILTALEAVGRAKEALHQNANRLLTLEDLLLSLATGGEG
ncbi:MAG: DNA polymerase III subunit delta' [Deltaproteobacteria bacterium]|nr:MAG: DNA polymerase III subunit delta' [Deltaproteobacteria bacterium]